MRFIRCLLAMPFVCLSLVLIPMQDAAALTASWLSQEVTAHGYVTAPNGEITIGCISGRDLKTYTSSGTVIRTIDSSATIDGVPNCITKPIVDQDGTLYGRPYSFTTDTYGPNLLAYDGSSLRWKYPITCTPNGTNTTVGSDGIIYVATELSSGVRLIGLNSVLAPSETVPSVVFDEPIQGCNVELQPFSQGIAVRPTNSATTTFFDSDGNTTGSVAKPGRVNSDGKLFSITPNSTATLNVAKYSTDGSQDWAYSNSGYTYGIGGIAYPAPDGGVFVLGYAQGDNQTETYITKIDSNGDHVNTIQITDFHTGDEVRISPPSMFGLPNAVVNDRGQFILYLGGSDQTDHSPILEITTISPSARIISQVRVEQLTDGTPYQMDAVKLGGDRSYVPESGGQWWGTPAVLVDIPHSGAGFDYPRSEIFDYQDTSLQYVALGDSYSSGEGVQPYVIGTDVDNYNLCHRSMDGYPMKLARSDLNLSLQSFAACSGAKIEHILDSNLDNSELPQAVRITGDTDLVTMSIGGNDVNFGPTIEQCVKRHDAEPGLTRTETEQQKCADALSDAQDILESNAFEEKLTEVYEDVSNLGGAATKLIILGYPPLFPEYDDIVGSCTWGSGAFNQTSGRTISESEASTIRNLTAQLNQLSADLIDLLNDPNVRFVDPTAQFASHELCASGAPNLNFVNEVINPGYQQESFHPNSRGHSDFSALIYSALASWTP